MKINVSATMDTIIWLLIAIFLSFLISVDGRSFFAWLKDWQTLLAGAGAVAAAFLTLSKMDEQIREDKERHIEFLKRKELSTRAKMCDAINDLIEFSKECFNCIINDDKEKLPAFNNEAIALFKDAVEFIDTQSGKKISKMLRFYQVYRARLMSYFEDKENQDTEQIIYDTIKLNAYFLNFFGYAREELPSISAEQLTEDDVFSSLRCLVGNIDYIKSPEKYKKYALIIEKHYGS